MPDAPLPLDLAALVDHCRGAPCPKLRHFWGHRTAKHGRLGLECLSQWYPAEFVVDGVRYATAEHFMMAGKARLFEDVATLARILDAGSPGAAKRLGREVRGFDDAIWEAHRIDLVVAGNVAKFGQHPALRDLLVTTGRTVLVEASPTDRIWGIGLAADHADAHDPLRWRGLNLLGFALMVVRDRLTAST